jgi:alpha-tubulin suppressor-like RCC1 family protein
VLADGAVQCWGRNSRGELGYGHTENIGDDETPASAGVVPLGARALQVVAGANHTCALLESGAVTCWGANEQGSLGYGHTEDIGDDETPASAGPLDLDGRARQLAAGASHTCALLDNGALRCWGRGDDGRLGYADTLGTDLYGEPNDIGDDETPATAGDVPLN